MTGYGVKIVADDVLPNDTEWMFLKGTDGSLTLYIAQSSAGCARSLAEAWAAFRCIHAQRTGCGGGIPEQRGVKTAPERLSI